MNLLRNSLLFVIVFLLSSPARGDLVVNGGFQGQVIYIDSTWAPLAVNVGEHFIASFTYDPTAIDQTLLDPTQGTYLGALRQLQFNFAGGFVLPVTLPVNGHVLVDQDQGIVKLLYPFGVRAATSDASYKVEAVEADLAVGTLANDGLPTSVVSNVSSIGAVYSRYTDSGSGQQTIFDFWFAVTPGSVTVSAVPEPAAGMLLLVAAMLTGIVRWVYPRLQPVPVRTGRR